MIKLFIVLTAYIYTISTSAMYVDKLDASTCTGTTYYTTQAQCESTEGNDCIVLPADYNCEYHDLVDNSFSLNSAKKTAYDNAKADKASEESFYKAIEDGTSIVAKFRFIVKDLSSTDKNTLMSDSVIQTIISNIQVGRIAEAKALADTLDLPNLPIGQSEVDDIKAYMTSLGY